MNTKLGPIALFLGALFLGTLVFGTTVFPVPPEAPVAVFRELDGAWEGEFAGYDLEGKEMYRISVRQVYSIVDAQTQQVQVTDTMADGTVITGRGENTARRLPDGSLELLCEVVKSNGDRVVHKGRLGTAPDGEPQLTWYSKGEDRWETFRETVRGHGKQAVYSIDGVGRYAETVIVMAGRYRRVPETSGSPPPAPPAKP